MTGSALPRPKRVVASAPLPEGRGYPAQGSLRRRTLILALPDWSYRVAREGFDNVVFQFTHEDPETGQRQA